MFCFGFFFTQNTHRPPSLQAQSALMFYHNNNGVNCNANSNTFVSNHLVMLNITEQVQVWKHKSRGVGGNRH